MKNESFSERGFNLLRTAAFLQIVSVAPFLYAVVMFLPSWLRALQPNGIFREYPFDPLILVSELDQPQLSLPLLASILLSMISVYVFLVPSASSFARWRMNLRTPSNLIKIGYWMPPATSLIAIAITVSVPIARWIEAVLTGVLLAYAFLLIGWIGLYLLFSGLSSAAKLDGFKVAAMLIAARTVVIFLVLLPLFSGLALAVTAALDLAVWYLVMDLANTALQTATSSPARV